MEIKEKNSDITNLTTLEFLETFNNKPGISIDFNITNINKNCRLVFTTLTPTICLSTENALWISFIPTSMYEQYVRFYIKENSTTFKVNSDLYLYFPSSFNVEKGSQYTALYFTGKLTELSAHFQNAPTSKETPCTVINRKTLSTIKTLFPSKFIDKAGPTRLLILLQDIDKDLASHTSSERVSELLSIFSQFAPAIAVQPKLIPTYKTFLETQGSNPLYANTFLQYHTVPDVKGLHKSHSSFDTFDDAVASEKLPLPITKLLKEIKDIDTTITSSLYPFFASTKESAIDFDLALTQITTLTEIYEKQHPNARNSNDKTLNLLLDLAIQVNQYTSTQSVVIPEHYKQAPTLLQAKDVTPQPTKETAPSIVPLGNNNTLQRKGAVGSLHKSLSPEDMKQLGIKPKSASSKELTTPKTEEESGKTPDSSLISSNHSAYPSTQGRARSVVITGSTNRNSVIFPDSLKDQQSQGKSPL